MNEENMYKVGQEKISHILDLIETNSIAIPEIQRPFVWNNKKVKDLIDSVYRGYPIGYLVIWSGDDIDIRNLESSKGKAVVIDGQQRILALETALTGMDVLDKNYAKKRVKVAFNPQADNEDMFMVANAASEKDPVWINDIAELFGENYDPLMFLDDYMEKNPEADRNKVYRNITKLTGVKFSEVGVITLNKALDLEQVTEIFNRLNSTGSPLGENDFAMSKISAADKYGGPELRAVIDRFCHLLNHPDTINFYQETGTSSRLDESEYNKFLKQYEGAAPPLYKPNYGDILRVVFLTEFSRGKLKDLVSLLSGRNFEKKTYEERIIEETFQRLKKGVLDFINPYHFNQFQLLLSSAGFKDSSLLRSAMTLDFCYFLYLWLNKKGDIPKKDIKSFVQKWFVLSTLTGRYIGSPETVMERDVRNLEAGGIQKLLKDLESATFSDAYWQETLPQRLANTSPVNAAFIVFKAALIHNNSKSLFSKIRNEELLILSGDWHHIFPKNFLKSNNMGQSEYNQVANLTPLDKTINILIGDKPPQEYFSAVLDACRKGQSVFGTISSREEYDDSLKENGIPAEISEMDITRYQEFLEKRRRNISRIIRDYYNSL